MEDTSTSFGEIFGPESDIQHPASTLIAAPSQVVQSSVVVLHPDPTPTPRTPESQPTSYPSPTPNGEPSSNALRQTSALDFPTTVINIWETLRAVSSLVGGSDPLPSSQPVSTSAPYLETLKPINTLIEGPSPSPSPQKVSNSARQTEETEHPKPGPSLVFSAVALLPASDLLPESTSSRTAPSSPDPQPSLNDNTAPPLRSRLDQKVPAPSDVASLADLAPVFSVGTVAYTLNSEGNLVIGRQTAAPGGNPINLDGTLVSLAPDASVLVAGSKTVAAEQPAGSPQSSSITPRPQPQWTALPHVVSVGGSAYTANSASRFIIDGQTVTPGGPPITVAGGTTVSVAADAGAAAINSATTVFVASSALVIDGQTVMPGGPAVTGSGGTTYSLPTSGNDIVINSATVPITESQALVIGSQTLEAGGPALTVSGTVISLAPGGSALVVGGRTEPLMTGSSTHTVDSTASSSIPTNTGAPGTVQSAGVAARSMKNGMPIVSAILLALHSLLL